MNIPDQDIVMILMLRHSLDVMEVLKIDKLHLDIVTKSHHKRFIVDIVRKEP